MPRLYSNRDRPYDLGNLPVELLARDAAAPGRVFADRARRRRADSGGGRHTRAPEIERRHVAWRREMSETSDAPGRGEAAWEL